MPGKQSEPGTSAAKPHLCRRCGRNFRRAEHLQRHVRTHTNERPFTCACGLAFTRRDLLRRHERLSHSEAMPGDHDEEHTLSIAEDETSAASDHLQPYHDDAVHSVPDGTDGPQQTSNAFIRVERDAFNTESSQDYSPGGSQDLMYGPIQTHQNNNGASPQPKPGASHDVITLSDGREMDMSLNFLYDETSQFQNFTEFTDSMGLPVDWFSAEMLPTNDNFETIGHDAEVESPVISNSIERENRPGSPFQPYLPIAQPGSHVEDSMVCDDNSSQTRLTMSADDRAKMEADLSSFQNVIPDFKLPSRHAMTRYLISFFEGFHTHLPFVHVPTFQISHCYPEFLLGMATLGAQYLFEHQNAERLFWAAKATILERIRRHGREFSMTNDATRTAESDDPSPPYLAATPQYIKSPTVSKTGESTTFGQLQVIKSIFLLLGFASWDPRSEILHEAIGFQSLLARCLRTAGLNTDHIVAPCSAVWHEWAQQESDRRTKLLAYTFLNVHSIAYNTSPALLNSEICLRLPCSTEEWNAEDAATWQKARSGNAIPQLKFQEALTILLTTGTSGAALRPLLSPLGHYVILHGIFQRIHLVRELSLSPDDSAANLPSNELDRLETALLSWTTSWKLSPESSLDPRNKNGPIPFTSSSLLGLAHVRLHLNLGPHRLLETRSPPDIAAAIFNAPAPQRHSRLVPALMYSVHALSIPVRLGVDYVARSQAYFWSVRHALASFECCILLTKWLCLLACRQNRQDYSENEARVIDWVKRVVDEAWSSIDREDEVQYSSPTPVDLGLAVVKIWARIFKKNVQWRFINILGLSLEIYSDKLRNRFLLR